MRVLISCVVIIANIAGCSGRKRQAIAVTCAADEVEQDGACVKKRPESPGTLNTGGSPEFEPPIPLDEPLTPQGSTDLDDMPDGPDFPDEPETPDTQIPPIDWTNVTGTTPSTQTPSTQTPSTQTPSTQTPSTQTPPTTQQTPPQTWQQTQQQMPAAIPSSLQMNASPAAASAGAPDVSLALHAENGNFQAYAAFSHTEQLSDLDVTYHNEPITFQKQLLSTGKLAVADLEMLVSMSFRFGTQICKVERVKVRPVAKTHRPKCG